MLEIKFAQLHSPIMVGGTNLGDRLNPELKRGLTLKYDRTEKELLVFYNKQVAIVPSTNIGAMIEDIKFEAKPVSDEVEEILRKGPSAQVDSPMSHVFAGPGAGKTGRSK